MNDFFGNTLEIGDVVAYPTRRTLELGVIFKFDRPYVFLFPTNRQADNADFTVKRKMINRTLIKAEHLKFPR